MTVFDPSTSTSPPPSPLDAAGQPGVAGDSYALAGQLLRDGMMRAQSGTWLDRPLETQPRTVIVWAWLLPGALSLLMGVGATVEYGRGDYLQGLICACGAVAPAASVLVCAVDGRWRDLVLALRRGLRRRYTTHTLAIGLGG